MDINDLSQVEAYAYGKKCSAEFIIGKLSEEQAGELFSQLLQDSLQDGSIELPLKCPQCGAEINTLYTDKQVHLEFSHGRWEEFTGSHDELVICPECYEELDSDDLDKLGVPNKYR